MAYYTVSGQPAHITRGLSAPIRSEFAAIAAAFATVEKALGSVTAGADFGKIYQGAYATDPTQRRDGSALQNGDLYTNTASKVIKTFVGGTWHAPIVDTSNVMTKDGGTFTGPVSGTAFTATGNMTAAKFIGSIAEATGLTSAQVLAALAYTPVNKAGDTMTGTLNGTAATYSGNVTAADFIMTSDERRKKLWAKVDDDVLYRFASMKKVGTYIDKKTGKAMAGVGAQSFTEVLPEAVTMDDDGFLGVSYGPAALVLVHKLTKKVLELEKRLAKLEK